MMKGKGFFILFVIFGCFSGFISGAPQYGPQRPIYVPGNDAPAPYDFEYKVENSPTNTFFGQNEVGDPQGRVTGNYYVLLPDGRLMNVDYTVDGSSGYLPRISFQNQGPSPLRGK